MGNLLPYPIPEKTLSFSALIAMIAHPGKGGPFLTIAQKISLHYAPLPLRGEGKKS
jgi:hypothetical protein